MHIANWYSYKEYVNIPFNSILQIILFFTISEDGRKCRTTVTMEGDNKLITEQIGLGAGAKCLKVVREFNENQVYLEMICEEAVSKQVYQRQL